jgi:ferredoxin
MPKYTIEYDREGCIGAGVCAAVCPTHWVIVSDGKADLVKGEKKSEVWVREIEEADFKQNLEAAEGCPVNVIHIKNEKGEKII